MSQDQRKDTHPSEVARELLDSGMSPSMIARRGFILASLGFLAACASGGGSQSVARSTGGGSSKLPPGLWTTDGHLPPQKWAQPASPSASREVPPVVRASADPKKPVVRAEDKPAAIAAGYNGKVIPRSAWTPFCPNPREMDPLGPVRKITVHHTGNPYAFTDTAVGDVKEELVHVLNGERGEGHLDIAYHFVIDPAGRVWEARDIRYEGRHTRDWKGVDNRSGNIGVMLLGNFERQKPSRAQLATLEKFVTKLQVQYKIPRNKSVGGRWSKETGVFTHQQLSPTECPGDNLASVWEKDIFLRLPKSV